MKVYSPSQTKRFLQCPMLWALSRQGWTPLVYNKGSLYAIRGTAASAGLDAFNQGLDHAKITQVVKESVSYEWERAKIDRREWSEFKSVPLNMKEITAQAIQLVDAYIQNPPGMFKPLHSEYIFENHGRARADVIGRTYGGSIIPIDYKCKDVPVQPYYQYLIRQEYRFDWQLMHYCWAVSEEFDTSCLEFGIILLWYAKKCSVEYVPFSVNPERLGNWLLSARAVWSDMESCENGEKPITEVSNHRTQYGPCEYSRACLDYNRDESLMYNDYFKILRG